MPETKLKINDLVLDHDNPRITHSEGQQEALQKIVKDQKTKLVKLAQSIAERGLNPMDNLLVLRVNSKPPQFIALEGNRRAAVLKILSNPAVMTGLEMAEPMRKIFERLAKNFDKKRVEPISAFELASRQDGDYWLELRHQGEQQGAGIVAWTSVASQRFGSRSPAIQALEMVTERGGLTADQRSKVTEKFPLSTLQRFVEDRKVRQALGIDVKRGKLVTTLPAGEVVKPLRRIVLDLATKQRRVGSLMKTDQMLEYVESFGKGDAPNLQKAKSVERTVDEIPIAEFARAARPATPRRKLDPSDRKEVVPRTCRLKITDNRIADIYKELRNLKLAESRNAIAVLLRVFLELSVDHFLETHGQTLTIGGSGGRFKKLDKKLAETIEILVDINVPRSHFAAVTRSLSVAKSPMNINLFHLYVHDRFATPLESELRAAWDHAQPLFEKIWP